MLSPRACQELDEAGFAILPGPVPADGLAQLSAAYDAAVENADPADVSVGSSTTRVSDFVNRGPAFDALYIHPPVLAACSRILGEPFKLSAMHARTLRTGMPAQKLHVDFARDSRGWNMVGFIFMVDPFESDNGATRFVPGSHLWPSLPSDPQEVLACGPAGSMIVYNGSVWHGHTVNRSSQPRRSIQGAYVRRDTPSPANLNARMNPETLARISPLAKYLLSA